MGGESERQQRPKLLAFKGRAAQKAGVFFWGFKKRTKRKKAKERKKGLRKGEGGLIYFILIYLYFVFLLSSCLSRGVERFRFEFPVSVSAGDEERVLRVREGRKDGLGLFLGW